MTDAKENKVNEAFMSLFSACMDLTSGVSVAGGGSDGGNSSTAFSVHDDPMLSFQCNSTLLFDENNLGGLTTSAEFDALKRPILSAIVIILYVIVLAFGVLGNGLVFVTVATNPRMRSATNVFIANLALADIFVCVFDLPLNLYYQLTDDWAFGTALCHIIPAVFGIVVYASTLTLTVIAADRFALIVVGVRRRMSPRLAVVLVLLIAAFSTIVALPVAVFSRHLTFVDPVLRLNKRYCVERWPSRRIRKLYTIATLIVQHFLPLAFIGVLYLLVFRHVRASRKQTGSRRRMSKTNRMLAAVVSVFAVAWTPYQLFSVVYEFEPALVTGPYFKFVDLMLRVVAMGSSGINPLLYGWMNASFRGAFAAVLRRRKLAGAGGGVAGDYAASARQTAAGVTEIDDARTPLTNRRAILLQTQQLHHQNQLKVDQIQLQQQQQQQPPPQRNCVDVVSQVEVVL